MRAFFRLAFRWPRRANSMPALQQRHLRHCVFAQATLATRTLRKELLLKTATCVHNATIFPKIAINFLASIQPTARLSLPRKCHQSFFDSGRPRPQPGHQHGGRVRSRTHAMAQALLPDDLWSLIAAYLPCHSRSPKDGRPRVNDRAALTGILFVLKTGVPWEYLPRELGCGSGMTCWRRLHEWMQAGVWQNVHEAILRRLREHDQIMWDRASIDAASVPAPFCL